jgi:hypothetical protein
MDSVPFSEINDLPGDTLMLVFGRVKFRDLDAPGLQLPKERSVQPGTMVYDMELARSVMDIPLLSKVCKQWMIILHSAIPLAQRKRMKTLITHHENYVMSQAARFVRALRLTATHQSFKFWGPPAIRDCVMNPVRNSYILFPSVRDEVFKRLWAAAEDRSNDGRVYRLRLSRVVSETLYNALLRAFETTGCMDERCKQACCYVWSSVTNTTPDRWEPLLHYDHAMLLAQRLHSHPALCTYVTKLSKTSTPDFHPNVSKMLQRGCKPRGVRRILPMSFAMPPVKRLALRKQDP